MYFIILLLTIMIPHSVINGMNYAYIKTKEQQDESQIDAFIKNKILSNLLDNYKIEFTEKGKTYVAIGNKYKFEFNNTLISEQISSSFIKTWKTELFIPFLTNTDDTHTSFSLYGIKYSNDLLIHILNGIGIIYNNVNKRFSLLEEEKKEIFRQYVKRNMKENKTIESIKAIIDEECTSYCTK